MSVKSFGSTDSHYSCNRASVLKQHALNEKKVQKERNETSATKSSWTPLGPNAKLNKKLFYERKDLISNWFAKWNDSQRKEILHLIIEQCTLPQKKFILDTVQPTMPVLHSDFTKLLPRYLALYIFSFLDPRSLSRCASVSWHWKYLAEADELWMPKCVELGWWPNFHISQFEKGIWKRLFVESILDLRNGRTPLGICQKPDANEACNPTSQNTGKVRKEKFEEAHLKIDIPMKDAPSPSKIGTKKTRHMQQEIRRRIKQLYPLRSTSLKEQEKQVYSLKNSGQEKKASSYKQAQELFEAVTSREEKRFDSCDVIVGNEKKDGRPQWATRRFINKENIFKAVTHGGPLSLLQKIIPVEAIEVRDQTEVTSLFSPRPWKPRQWKAEMCDEVD